MTRKQIPAHVEVLCDRCGTVCNGEHRIVVRQLAAMLEEYDFCDPCMSVVVGAIKQAININNRNEYE